MQEDGLPLSTLVEHPGDSSLWGSDTLLVIKSIRNPEEGDELKFDTPGSSNLHSSGDYTPAAAEAISGYLMPSSVVIPVRKTGRNPFTSISVGRARNNDIVLADTSVSKVHAYLDPPVGDSRQWRARDAGSKNGTKLFSCQIARLERDAPVPIEHGFEIKFGLVRCLFADVETFRDAALWASRAWRKGS